MFDSLMDEVECINRSYGYVGCLDAIQYISTNREEYKGTAVYRQLLEIMGLGEQMFAEV